MPRHNIVLECCIRVGLKGRWRGKVERDLRVAGEWLEKAAGQGHGLARGDLKIVEMLMKDSVLTGSSPAKVQVQVQAGSKGMSSKLKSLWKR